MVIAFGSIVLIVNILYFIKVSKSMIIHDFKHIPSDGFLYSLDNGMALWKHLLLCLFGISVGMWILVYDQNLLGFF